MKMTLRSLLLQCERHALLHDPSVQRRSARPRIEAGPRFTPIADDSGSELHIFDTATNRFVYRYVEMGRDYSQLVSTARCSRSAMATRKLIASAPRTWRRSLSVVRSILRSERRRAGSQGYAGQDLEPKWRRPRCARALPEGAAVRMAIPHQLPSFANRAGNRFAFVRQQTVATLCETMSDGGFENASALGDPLAGNAALFPCGPDMLGGPCESVKLLSSATFLLLGCTAAFAADDLLERLDQSLTVSAFGSNLRARLSGTVDLEGYYFPRTPPGLVYASGHSLFNPRLTLFLDAQLGSPLYFFAQARADRGFDPTDGGAEVRLDEYALRVTPWKDGRFNLQIGQFATIAGNWIPRHLSWDNPFVNAPLPYENITAQEDMVPPASARDFARGIEDEKEEYLPVIWGPSYATGVSVAGRVGKFDYAAELKNAALSSRPESWSVAEIDFEHPTVTARVGFRPDPAWNLGVSASRGPYFRPEAAPELPGGRGIGDYQQFTLGQDISFAWHHWQLWAEFYGARFEVPQVGNADTLAYYLEAKYKFTPQFSAALRWNQQFFSTVPDGNGGQTRWGDDLSRVDVALSYRFTLHTQLKLQYSPQRTGSGEVNHNLAAQFTLRF